MKLNKFVGSASVFIAALSFGYGGTASATQVPVALNYSWLASGFSSGTGNPTPTPMLATDSGVYGDTFVSQQLTMIPGSNYGLNRDVPNGGTNLYDGSAFYDDYVFSIAPSSVTNSVTSTITLGNLFVTDLSSRLYALASCPTLGSPGAPCIGPANNPLTGPPIVEGWATPIGGIGEFVVLAPVVLAPGTYVLEVRGNVPGTAGGSYSGVINFAEVVPVPAAAWLFGSALGLLGLRRRAT